MATSPTPALPARAVTPPPAETILAAIEAGQLDDQLPALGEAINDRNRRIAADRTRRALEQLAVGQRVRLDGHISPRYLQGRTGTIHRIDRSTVTVCLDTPVGRFTEGHISCSPRVVHPVPAASHT
ncbi:MAG: hypothetical protein ACRDVW_10085 [Acidimicrobiales bacterium]